MDPATRALINSSLIAVFGTVLAFASAWFWAQKNAAIKEAERLAANAKELDRRVVELENRLTLVNQAVVPINAAMQALLIKELTHFHTPEMDALLVKLGPPVMLTGDEETRLFVMLKARMDELNGSIPEAERDAAQMLPLVMKRVKADMHTVGPVEVKAVYVPVGAEGVKTRRAGDVKEKP